MKIRDFLLQHKGIVKKVVITLLFAIFGVPLIINVLFKIKAPFEIFDAEWYAEDALSYYGSVLAFLGTAAFSALALWQNHVIKTENDKYLELKEKREKEKNAPFFVAQGTSCFGNGGNLSLTIENKTDNIAKDVSIYDFKIIDEKGTVIWSDDKCFTRTSMVKGQTVQPSFKNNEFKDGHKMQIRINYKDVFDNDYSIVLESISKWEHLPSFNIVKK